VRSGPTDHLVVHTLGVRYILAFYPMETTQVLSRISTFSAACLFAALISVPTDANAQSSRVRAACTADAKRLCSQYSPGSTEMRSCMQARGRSLSQGCVAALEADGLVPRGTLARYRSRN
jgi:hypothetical protein